MDDYPATAPAARCEEHGGLHAVHFGRCLAVGKQVPRNRYAWHFGRCVGCGIDLDFRRDTVTSSVETLVSGTDNRHYHAPDRTGDKLDAVADGLVELQATLAAMLAERRAARAPSPEREEAVSRPNAPAAPARRVIE